MMDGSSEFACLHTQTLTLGICSLIFTVQLQRMKHRNRWMDQRMDGYGWTDSQAAVHKIGNSAFTARL